MRRGAPRSMKMTGCDRARSDAVPERDTFNSPRLRSLQPWVSGRISMRTLKGLCQTILPIFVASTTRPRQSDGYFWFTYSL